MTTPLTTEIPQRLEPVTHDPFIDDLDDGRGAPDPARLRRDQPAFRPARLLARRARSSSTLTLAPA
jgi:hypothetical protein